MRYGHSLNGTMVLASMMLAAAYNPQYNPPKVRDTRRECLDTRACKAVDSRQLREFSVKGHKIMAYSKKDAITRLRHQKII